MIKKQFCIGFTDKKSTEVVEERFNYDYHDEKIIDNQTGKTYDKNNYHMLVIDGLLNQLNNENEQLKQREKTLLCEIEDFQELLAKNDCVCYKRVLQLLDDKISFLYKAKADMINVDEYRYTQIGFAIQILRELKKELEE